MAGSVRVVALAKPVVSLKDISRADILKRVVSESSGATRWNESTTKADTTAEYRAACVQVSGASFMYSTSTHENQEVVHFGFPAFYLSLIVSLHRLEDVFPSHGFLRRDMIRSKLSYKLTHTDLFFCIHWLWLISILTNTLSSDCANRDRGCARTCSFSSS